MATHGSGLPQMAQLALYGSEWPLWLHVAQVVSRLPLMAKDGYMASCGSVQPLLVQDGLRLPRWLKIAICLHMAPDGFIWLLNTIMTKYGSRLPQMAQYGSLWL